MKQFIACLLVILPLLQIEAQRAYLPTSDDLNKLQTTKTYVVLDDNPMSDYNFDIREAVEKVWTITEYEFLEHDDFEEKSLDPNASFLYLAFVNLEKDKSNARYKFLCLSLGGPDRENLDDLKDIANLPLGYAQVEEEHYLYHLGVLLRFMQNHVRELTATPTLVTQNVYQRYNKNMGLMKDKVLYLVADELAPDISTEAAISKNYPYPFEIVDRERVQELIASNDKDAVFLHKVGPQNKNVSSRVFKLLFGTADAKLYFYEYHKANDKNPDAILKNDLKRIGKAPQH